MSESTNVITGVLTFMFLVLLGFLVFTNINSNYTFGKNITLDHQSIDLILASIGVIVLVALVLGLVRKNS